MMGITNLWPLALLILVPGILLLYILKQQASPRPFSSVMLWREVYRNLEATTPWEKLRRNLLLFLQIAAILLFVAAMVGPWIRSLGSDGEQVVLVIDNSASMDTLYEGETTRLEAAKEAACDYVDGLGSQVTIHVIVGNQQAALAVTGSSDHSEIKKRIRAIEQTNLAGDMSVTLGLVQSCARQAEESDIVFFTDTAFELNGLEASVESFYSEAEDLSLDSLSATEKDNQLLLLALVSNYGTSTVTEDVNLYGMTETAGEETLLAIEAVTVEPGETASLYFTVDSAKLGDITAFHALLNEEDALKGNNESWCIRKEEKNTQVLLVTESNLFVEKAFSNLAGTEVYRTSDPETALGGDSYDLYIFDGLLPQTLPEEGNFLFLNCRAPEQDGEALFAAAEEAEGTRFTLQDTEATSYVAGATVGVNRSWIYELPAWGNALLSGSAGCGGFYGSYDGHRMAVIGFDLHQTDFALTAEFPVLIADLAGYLTEGSLVSSSSYETGESLILYGSTAGGNLEVTDPTGTLTAVESDNAYGAYLQVETTGIYRVSQQVGESLRQQYFAVLYPCAEESNVSSAQTMLAEARAGGAQTVRGSLSLRRYLLLLLLVLLVLEFVIYVRQMPGGRKRSRRIGEIILRSAVLLLTLLAICDLSVEKKSKLTTTVFVVDLSDSLGSSIHEEEAFVREAIAGMPEDNQAGIIVFGSDTSIEQFVTDKKAFTGIQSTVTSTATNLQQALQSALTLFSDDSARRIVLLTDGNENQGDITQLTAAMDQADVEFLVRSYDSSVEEEVYVSNVTLPETISQGDQFQVKVEIYATEATEATVSLYSGRTLKGQKDAILQKGSNQLIFSDRGVEAGIRSYRVVVDAKKDTVSVNNTYSAYTTVEAPSLILLVEGNSGDSKALTPVLDAANLAYEVVSPAGVPNSLSDMLRYDTVILQNVYAPDLREGFLDTLDTYVSDYAGGLICVGGEDAYALGNYQNTVLEDILPVSSNLEGEKEVPSIAMVFVIDHSGSMDSASTGHGNITCLDVAKNAAINALDSLRTIDQVGVIAFDDSYDWTVALQDATDLDGIRSMIQSIPYGGGTSIYPAVEAAALKLKESSAAIRHIVLLTDGQDYYNEYEPLFAMMKEQGITLSTVAIGTDADESTLQWMAEEGGGRNYYSDAGSELPRIFAQEIFLSTEAYRINEEFTPVLVNSHEILQDVFDEGSPSLLGYVATTNKSTAIELLETARKDPLLSVWQYGLGHVAAWTSDAAGQWSANFSGWENYVTLWRNLVDWSITNTDRGADSVSIEQQAASAVISYETEDYSSATSVTAILTDEDGKQKEVTLSPTAPGHYQASVDLTETGVYSVSLRNSEGEQSVRSINTAMAMQYSQEYRFAEVSSNLKDFTNRISGRYITAPQEVFENRLQGAVTRHELTLWLLLSAVLLFAVDVLCRRMRIDWLGGIASAFVRGKGGIQRRREERKTASVSEPAAKETSAAVTVPTGSQKKSAPPVKRKAAAEGKSAKKAGPETIDTSALLKKKKDRE